MFPPAIITPASAEREYRAAVFGRLGSRDGVVGGAAAASPWRWHAVSGHERQSDRRYGSGYAIACVASQ
jgi:hypothetical protein